MPIVIQQEEMQGNAYFAGTNFNYDYPNGMNLKPDSELHKKTLAKLMNYARRSAQVIKDRFPSWMEMDDKLQAFILLSDAEKKVKKKDPRKPVSIVFPYTYAILETLVSYLVSAFFPEPMFRYEGVGPEDVGGAFLMQQVINLHVVRNKAALNLHTMFRDSNAYGIGVVSPQWIKRIGKKIVKDPVYYADSIGRITQTGTQRRIVEDAVLFEGNSLQNVDPYRFLPDPTVSIHDVQAGEFVGWVDTINYHDLLTDENTNGSGSDYFNVKYVRGILGQHTTIFGSSDSGLSGRNQRGRNRAANNLVDRDISKNVDRIHLYVKLIPKEWEISSSESPEKWLFTIANDSVIIGAKPLGLHSDLFPVAISAPDFDGYSPVAYSRLEILSGMQTVIDWLFNAHITNVRKAINDLLIVDPYLLNMEDLRDPEPGGLVRLRRAAWGKGVKDAAMQLGITDITARNMQDVALVINYMQQIMGTDNPVMGNLRQGGPERLTGTEFEGTAKGAVSRLERVAKITGIMAMQDIGYQFAYNTQQLMEQEVYIKTVGDWPQEVLAALGPNNQRVKVSPDDILVDYDMLVRDGSIPGRGNVTDMLKLYEIIVQNPGLSQQIDTMRLFDWIALEMGAKNVSDFHLQPSGAPPQVNVGTAPDEQVMNEVQKGNMIPMGGMLGSAA